MLFLSFTARQLHNSFARGLPVKILFLAHDRVAWFRAFTHDVTRYIMFMAWAKSVLAISTGKDSNSHTKEP